jgi:hypothetical protein
VLRGGEEVRAAGRLSARRLRRSFASQMILEGRGIAEAAEQQDCSPAVYPDGATKPVVPLQQIHA